MLLKKLTNIFNDNKYYALSISNVNGVSEYYLITLLFKDNELKVEDRYKSKNIDDAFKAHLNKNYPVLLHIEGDNIINKSVENKAGYRKNLIFKSNLDDFYFYEYKQEETVFVSVARKELINAFIKEINTLDVFVIDLSFGPFVMVNLLPVIKKHSSISSTIYTIEINENRLLSFKNEGNYENQYIINGDTFNTNEVPLIGAFLGYKFPNNIIEFDTDFLSNNASEFKFKKWFKTAYIFSIFFFLISLFTSHLLHNVYVNALVEKESVYALSQETTTEINKLKEEKKLKEKILETTNISNKSFITKYVVDIGNSTLPEITLKKVHVMPKLKKIEHDKKIDFHFNIISITGKVTDDETFNRWIKKIKKLKWIEKLDIVAYSQENKITNEFILKIEI
ncbi:hypothetical protein [Flavivirga rizhaonensis]|uniref:General secretion pathway protein n=1 Tax=Flavivirga rizhaonensis TaxID=2559571 RepID=A0A4S1DUH6_9FLAO|nr:hypothetical protein [Flavivirga rizhaonensis]TGV01062.1 hypothetical protein EM932_17025 [Flavivirga rizhaonensis]